MINLNSKYCTSIQIQGQKYHLFDIKQAAKEHNIELAKLPYSLRILLENAVRHGREETLPAFASWLKTAKSDQEVDYFPARVLMQDFTGVPAIVDLASMRDAMKALGKDPLKINPLIPVDLVIDHSIQVDEYANKSAFEHNVQKEMSRNKERYEFLKWGQQSFRNFRVVPPGTGICHQVNIEYLATVVHTENVGEEKYLYPDSLVGTDSHTTMVGSLAILGWGVGGIEAEAAMLGQPLPMILPEVVGFELTGELQDGITATDLVLTITEMLRKKKVVGKFVEFYGAGLAKLSLADRATIANMAPEYGATCGFFPIDAETIKYLLLTGRSPEQVDIVEQYAKAQGLWLESQPLKFTDTVSLDMAQVQSSIAGPKRPQDRVFIASARDNFEQFAKEQKADLNLATHSNSDTNTKPLDGSIVIAAITSCTNTSNPSVMIAAGLVAKKAAALGAQVKPWVKTSLAPGSKVVTEYLAKCGLDKSLDQLGFNLVGYGCTTCIGNSGPLAAPIEQEIRDKNLLVASILSGNRNFEGRIHPLVKANYLASPPLVVAYALAGRINIDITNEPLTYVSKTDASGKAIKTPVYLKDIWPSKNEIEQEIQKSVNAEMFIEKYQNVFSGDKYWRDIIAAESETYHWRASTYINNPPYFEEITKIYKKLQPIKKARILALFGDSITTDHISPAGNINKTSPAAKYLMDCGVPTSGFNSYGARRGNHEVMMRGTFANVRLKNLLCPGVEGGVTMNFLNNQVMSIYDAAMLYKQKNVPLVIFAGREYGTGSSRDWAAKGTNLLGVKAVIAESFERIHRSNLVGMGVLPLALPEGTTCQSLNLVGDEEVNILNLDENIQPGQTIKCHVVGKKTDKLLELTAQIYTENEIEYLKSGSILASVVHQIAKT